MAGLAAARMSGGSDSAKSFKMLPPDVKIKS